MESEILRSMWTGGEVGMKRNQYAEMKFKNGASMYVNTDYITSYAYLYENDETIVSILSEQSPIYFPGNQMKEIENAINRIDA